MNEHEAYMRARCDGVRFENGRVYWPQANGSEAILSCNPQMPLSPEVAWRIANEELHTHEREIAEVETDVATCEYWIDSFNYRSDCGQRFEREFASCKRLLTRTQAHLATLKRGMKPPAVLAQTEEGGTK